MRPKMSVCNIAGITHISHMGHYLPRYPNDCIRDKHFPANWLPACHDDNWKSCILNGDRLSCQAQDVVHLSTSDANK